MIKNNKWKILTGALLIIISGIIVGCSDNSNEKGKSKSSGIVPLYSPGVGGTNYIISTGIGKMVDDSGELPDTKLSTQSTNGSSEIIKSVSDDYNKGSAAFGTPASDIATEMYEGEWEELPGEFDELRAVARISYAANHIVVPQKSSVESFEDIEGKKIGMAPEGSSPYNFMTKLLEEEYGLTVEEDYEAIPLGNPDIQDGIKDGSLDVGVLTGAVPASLVTELASTENIKIISADEEKMDSFLEDYPYYDSIKVEAETYDGQEQEITLGLFQTMLMTHEGVDEDLVYTVMKEMWDQADDLKEIHPDFEIDEDTVLDGIEVPLHPGAEKLYEEEGILDEE